MASNYELDLEVIVKKFWNVSDLTYWAVENNFLNNSIICSRLDYLISIENTVKSFTDCNDLIAWAVQNKLTYIPLVRERIGYLSHEEDEDSENFISCEKCKKKFSSSFKYNKHKCSNKHFCIECKAYFVNIENHSKIHKNDYTPNKLHVENVIKFYLKGRNYICIIC